MTSSTPRGIGKGMLLAGVCLAVAIQTRPAAGDGNKPSGADAIAVHLQAIARSSEKQCLALQKQYVAALRAARKKLQTSGDLGGILALDEEIARVTGEGWRTNAPVLPAAPALGGLPDRWVKAMAGIGAQAKTARLAIYDEAIQQQDERIRDLVRNGKIEQAKALDQERLRLVAGRQAIGNPPATTPTQPTPASGGAPTSTAGTPPGPQPVQRHAPRGYWTQPWRPSLPNYAQISHFARPGTQPIALPYSTDFDGPFYGLNVLGFHNSIPGTSIRLQRSAVTVDTFGQPQAGQETYGPSLTLPLEHAGDFQICARLRVRTGQAAAGRLALFAVLENGRTVAVSLLDMSAEADRLVWSFEIYPDWAGPRAVLQNVPDASGEAVLDFHLERQGDQVKGWIADQPPQQHDLRASSRSALITAGVTFHRSTLPDSVPLVASLDRFDALPDRGPTSAVTVPSTVATAASNASGSTPSTAANTETPHLLNLTFDGNDLPKVRREGTGKLIEQNGRLMVENFGTNTRLKPHFGMRLYAQVVHRGDFTLRALTTVDTNTQQQQGLIRLTAFFSNRSEAVCEVRADGNFNGAVTARYTGQADQTKLIRRREGYFYYSMDSGERPFMNTRDLPLQIVRQGTRLTLLAGTTAIGQATLPTEATTFTGVAIDLERSRNKNSQPAEMWVESLVLSP